MSWRGRWARTWRPGALALLGPGAPLAGAQLERLTGPAVLASDVADGARPALSWLFTLALIWGLGCVGLLVRLVRDVLTARELLRAATPVTSGRLHETLAVLARRQGLAQPPELRVNSGVGPFTAGALWPTIVAPAEAEHWSAANRQAVLAHELAHVRRRD